MTLKCVYVIFISLACSNMGLVPTRFGIKCAINKTKNIKKYKCTIQLTIHFATYIVLLYINVFS